MLKSAFVILALLLFGSISILPLQGDLGIAKAGEYLQPEQSRLLREVFATHANYFLSDEVIPKAGIPCTAYKVGDRARFGYSNPTEWGYAMQAWIAAFERGLVSEDWTLERVSGAVKTIRALQADPTQRTTAFRFRSTRLLIPRVPIFLSPCERLIPTCLRAITRCSMRPSWSSGVGPSLAGMTT